MYYDPQTAEGHYCAKCLREIFGNDIYCQKCLNRMTIDDDIDYE